MQWSDDWLIDWTLFFLSVSPELSAQSDSDDDDDDDEGNYVNVQDGLQTAWLTTERFLTDVCICLPPLWPHDGFFFYKCWMTEKGSWGWGWGRSVENRTCFSLSCWGSAEWTVSNLWGKINNLTIGFISRVKLCLCVCVCVHGDKWVCQ